jgi:hypothetical protein
MMPDQMTMCGAESPHKPKKISGKRADSFKPVQRNRPYGHEGPHGWSDGKYAMVAVWLPSGEVIR